MNMEGRGVRYWTGTVVIAVALASVGILGAHAMKVASHKEAEGAPVAVRMAKDPGPVSLADFRNGFSSVVDPAMAAVVNISSTKVVKKQFQVPGFFNDPFFQQFFGNQFGQQSTRPQTEREYSLGSGVIVNPNGYLLTNNHVIDGATDIEVVTQDKKKFKAKVVGTDPQTDVAVLKIDATELPTLTLGDSSTLKVGDVVFAIGDPFGIGETATMGIVSATGRALGQAIEHYENFIQTDASINPGNSGGALIDLHGDLVGINTAILSGSGGNQGIGFAIPIAMAHNIMDQIIEHGKVVRGHLGVLVQGVSPDMGKAFGLSQGGGALVGDVTPGSPAAKAGIQRGDVILDVNGEPVNGADDLSVKISETAPGTVVHLKVYRDKETRDVAVTLGEASEQETSSANGANGGAAMKGVEVENLTPSTAHELGLPAQTSGVVVTSVDSSSAAAASDLERGDVIQEINHKPVHNLTQYNDALAGTDNQAVLLLVNRGGETHFVVVTPQ